LTRIFKVITDANTDGLISDEENEGFRDTEFSTNESSELENPKGAESLVLDEKILRYEG